MNRLRLSAEMAHLPAGSVTYCHKRKGCASSAYEISEKKAKLLLSIPRALGAHWVVLNLYDQSFSEVLLSTNGCWIKSASGYDQYEFQLDIVKLGVGLYFFDFGINTGDYTLYSNIDVGKIKFSAKKCCRKMCQLSVVDFKYDEPSELYGGTIYHIFVDRFNRGGDVPIKDGAELVGGEWDVIPEYPEYPGAPLKNNCFYGGTLWGIADKLDYISSLGVNVIYLSPIFDSASNHKYDTGDYMRVDEMFGGEEALQHLIAECDNRNIKLILDGVFNHTGADSIYFNKFSRYDSVGAFQSSESDFYEWYDFKSYPDKYTCWWGIDILPRINPDIESCRRYFTGKNGVIRKYRDMGIYGLWLDVADELSDDFISEIKECLCAGGESLLYGEVWEDASNKIAYDKRKSYYLGNELDGVMNYPLRSGIIDYIQNKSTDKLSYALNDIIINAPERIAHAQMNFLGTHDTERIITVFGDASSQGLTNAELSVKRMSDDEMLRAVSKVKMAYTVLATVPGIPAIFYGDEAGLQGYSDPFNRMPYPWNKESGEMIAHFARLGKIRKENAVYQRGEFKICLIDSDLFIFKRTADKDSFITVCNNGKSDIKISFKHKVDCLIDEKNGRNHTVKAGSAEIFKAFDGDDMTVSKPEAN